MSKGDRRQCIAARLEGITGDDRGAILTNLYQEYGQRFRSDNNGIWTTGAIMVPLSLGSFGLLASLSDPSRGQVIVLPLIGLLLMTIWFVIAENLRAFQEGSMAWLEAIEQAWHVRPAPETAPAAAPDKPAGCQFRPVFSRSIVVGPSRVRNMRLALLCVVTIAAVLTMLFWPGGIFGSGANRSRSDTPASCSTTTRP